jgi:hypothetical protein
MKKYAIIIFAAICVLVSILLAQTDKSTLPKDAETAQSTTKKSTAYLENKKYAELSQFERHAYIAAKLEQLSLIKEMKDSPKIKNTDFVFGQIKQFIESYANRTNKKELNHCGFRDNLQSIFNRASKNAPMIISAFNQEGVNPEAGLYLAMLESEHCVCLQSPTGPLGLFQLNRKTAEEYGLKVFKDASPSNPDERCDPKASANVAARYLKDTMKLFESKPDKLLYALAAYNSGEPPTNSAIKKANSDSFWSALADNKKSPEKYKFENFKYVPKLLAAAIIGENPKDFDLEFNPLSSYHK